jgi:hypothetical protein
LAKQFFLVIFVLETGWRGFGEPPVEFPNQFFGG